MIKRYNVMILTRGVYVNDGHAGVVARFNTEREAADASRMLNRGELDRDAIAGWGEL